MKLLKHSLSEFRRNYWTVSEKQTVIDVMDLSTMREVLAEFRIRNLFANNDIVEDAEAPDPANSASMSCWNWLGAVLMPNWR